MKTKLISDDLITPDYVIKSILPILPEETAIWCPFDTLDSQFVKVICEHKPVAYSHISFGQDFLEYEPDSWDVIVSKPPLKDIEKIIERALSFKKPFAFFVPTSILNDAKIVHLFGEGEMQKVTFARKIKFLDSQGNSGDDTTFSYSFLCYDLLTEQSNKVKS